MRRENICLGCMEANMVGNICPHCGYQTEVGAEASLYLVPGTILDGKYLVGRFLGQGGFGITYLAWDTNLDIRIAVKEFFPQGLVSRVPGEGRVVSCAGAANDQFRFGVESFLREAKMLARFEHHPSIVTVRDFFKENGTAYMVMSYIDGLTLEDYLTTQGGRISVKMTVSIMMQVMDALKEVHKVGIMHRDISPDNIYINRKSRIILIDFGAARHEMREVSKSFSIILKAGYAPEEQYRSRGRQGPWSDIYAVGATFYRCITGKAPIEAMDRLVEDDLLPPSQLGVAIEPAVEKALLKAISIKAENRYQNVDEFQKALLTAGPSLKETPREAKMPENITPYRPQPAPIKHDVCPTCNKQIKPGETGCKNCEVKLDIDRQRAKKTPVVRSVKVINTAIYSIAAVAVGLLILIALIGQLNAGQQTNNVTQLETGVPDTLPASDPGGMISVEVVNNTEEIAISYAAFFGPGLEEFGEDMLGEEYINPGDTVVFQLPEGEYNLVLFTYELYIVESVWNINQDVKVEIGGENLFPIRVENRSPEDIALFYALPSGTLGYESEEAKMDNEQLLKYQLLADNDFIIAESGNRFFFLEVGLYDFIVMDLEGETYFIGEVEIDVEAKKVFTIH